MLNSIYGILDEKDSPKHVHVFLFFMYMSFEDEEKKTKYG